MKWKTKSKPEIGDRRIIKVFLWFPLELKGEGRWWMKTKVLQEYRLVWKYRAYVNSVNNERIKNWEDVSWADELEVGPTESNKNNTFNNLPKDGSGIRKPADKS